MTLNRRHSRTPTGKLSEVEAQTHRKAKATPLLQRSPTLHSSETAICRRVSELREVGTGVPNPRTPSRTVRAFRMHQTNHRGVSYPLMSALAELRLRLAFMHLRRTDAAWDLSPEVPSRVSWIRSIKSRLLSASLTTAWLTRHL